MFISQNGGRREIMTMKGQVFSLCIFLTFLIGKCSGEGENCGIDRCYKGICVNETIGECECNTGWGGSNCDSCLGRIRLKETAGSIVESYGNYSLDTKCSWLIEGVPNVKTRLRFQQFATECSWDHLYIYDGNSVFSNLVAVLSGLVIAEGGSNRYSIPEITTYSGYTYLHFYSDAAYNMSGFNITYKMFGCPLDCSGHGSCDMGSQLCTCEAGWRGAGCDIPQCRNGCGEHGSCTQGNKPACQCDPGFRGDDCSVADSEGVWSEVSQSVPDDAVLAGRASHKTVVHADKLWMASGHGFGPKEKFQNLASFDLITEQWTYHDDGPGIHPEQRYGHSLVEYRDSLYMYGGLQQNLITNELWQYDVSTHLWHLRVPSLGHGEPSNEMIAVVGHTAHVVGDTMYVIFGHSPTYGYVNKVQECFLGNLTWSLAQTSGAIVKGGYGHSSVYDDQSGAIFVHAGYHSGSSSAYYLSDSLYSYHPAHHTWTILRGSGQYKYLHSAVIISGLMLVFGGNTHNDTSISKGAKCYSTDFLTYHIECDRWDSLPGVNLQQDISRFGHTADVYKGAMYVFGGFNGLLLSDMYRFDPGKCEKYVNEEECLSALPGVLCAWSDEQKTCMTHQQAEEARNQKVITEYILGPECPSRNDLAYQCSSLNELKTCPSCVSSSYGCEWCDNICQSAANCMSDNNAMDEEECLTNFKRHSTECINLHNCHSCEQSSLCNWSEGDKCESVSSVAVRFDGGTDGQSVCLAACHNYSSCENCTNAKCMWCSNQKRCVESNSYVASFPYGQCMEWTTQKAKCPATRCVDLQTCERCQKNPACGWCDNGQNMGLGSCMEGGAEGPVDVNGTHVSLAPGRCPLKERWYFTKCPLCQCNGHSMCIEGTDICDRCQNNTDGAQCENCKKGFYGMANNGGNCTECECNGQTDICHQQTGKCHCRTRGVMGDNCDVCDEGHKYMGNPQNGGTCYYSLQIDFQFTFNLSKEDDKWFTRINFMNTPTSHDKDVDFNINCSTNAWLNITVKSESQPIERQLVTAMECGTHKEKFSHKEHDFGSNSENTTFYVYVYDFKTPFTLQISFSQFPQIDLVHFFVTFFSCFLSLLLIAAILWKVKQRYDLMQRRQRMFVEMEQMASRPFAACAMEVTDRNPPLCLKKEPPDVRGSRRKKLSKPSPVSLEPIYGHKAAVLTLIVSLPTGDEDYTPPGQAGLIMASALVTLGNTRKASVEHSKGDKSKARKVAVQASAGSDCL